MSVELFGGNQTIELKQWGFPAGERGITIVRPQEIERFKSFTIIVHFRSSDDLIDMMLLVDACRRSYKHVKLRLYIPYFPYARQDRVTSPGESFSLYAITQMIKLCDFTEIEVLDPHSDVLEGMFEPGKLHVRTQDELWYKHIAKLVAGSITSAIVAPDAGASKKAWKTANLCGVDCIVASKVRDAKSGKIIGSDISMEVLDYDQLIILDDICDGGRTFIELAKLIKSYNYKGKLILCVTHGIFSAGKEELMKHFDAVYSLNPFLPPEDFAEV